MYLYSGNRLIAKFETAKSTNNLESFVSTQRLNNAVELGTATEEVDILHLFVGKVEQIFLHNADDVAHVVEVIVSINGAKATLTRQSLAAGETLEYNSQRGFSVV